MDDSVNAYAERGKAYLAQSKYEKAVADFTEVLHLAPKMTTSALRMRRPDHRPVGPDVDDIAGAPTNPALVRATLALDLAPMESIDWYQVAKAADLCEWEIAA